MHVLNDGLRVLLERVEALFEGGRGFGQILHHKVTLLLAGLGLGVVDAGLVNRALLFLIGLEFEGGFGGSVIIAVGGVLLTNLNLLKFGGVLLNFLDLGCCCLRSGRWLLSSCRLLLLLLLVLSLLFKELAHAEVEVFLELFVGGVGLEEDLQVFAGFLPFALLAVRVGTSEESLLVFVVELVQHNCGVNDYTRLLVNLMISKSSVSENVHDLALNLFISGVTLVTLSLSV